MRIATLPLESDLPYREVRVDHVERGGDGCERLKL